MNPTLKSLTRSYRMSSHISDLGSLLSCLTRSLSLWSDFSKKNFKFRRLEIQDWACRAEKKIMWWPSQQGLSVLQKYTTSNSQLVDFSKCLSNCNITFLCMLSNEDPTVKHFWNTNNTYMLYTQITGFASLSVPTAVSWVWTTQFRKAFESDSCSQITFKPTLKEPWENIFWV